MTLREIGQILLRGGDIVIGQRLADRSHQLRKHIAAILRRRIRCAGRAVVIAIGQCVESVLRAVEIAALDRRDQRCDTALPARSMMAMMSARRGIGRLALC